MTTIQADIPRYDFQVTQGDPIDGKIQIRDSDTDALIVWTGASIKMQVRESLSDETPVVDMSTANGKIVLESGGTVIHFTEDTQDVIDEISVSLTARTGKVFPTKNYYFDLEITPSGGVQKTYLRGLLIVTAQVTA